MRSALIKSEQINELAAALSKAQADIRGAVKDSSNPFFKSKYADLESIWDAIRLPLTKNGLSLVQIVTMNDENLPCLLTALLHSSGQWIEGICPLKPVKDDPQGMGSCISYMRRYAAAAITGVVQIDDDGEGAHGRKHDDDKKSDVPPPVKSQQVATRQVNGPPDPEPPPMGTSRWDSHKKSAPIKDPGKFVIAIGKFAGKTVEQISKKEMFSYIEYMDVESRKNGRPMSNPLLTLIDHAKAYWSAQKEQQSIFDAQDGKLGE